MRWPQKYPREPGTGCADDPPLAMEVFYSQGQAYTDPQRVQDGLFSRPRIPGSQCLPESSQSSGDHVANSLSNRADISSLADTSARFLRHSSNRPRPEPSLTFLILVIYKCCPDVDVFVAQLWHNACPGHFD